MSAWWWLLWAPTFMSLLALAVGRMLRDPHDSERTQLIAEARRRTAPLTGISPNPAKEWVYTGPDQLRLLEETDAELTAYAAGLRGLYDDNLLALTPAQVDAGCDRLRDAINEHRKEQP